MAHGFLDSMAWPTMGTSEEKFLGPHLPIGYPLEVSEKIRIQTFSSLQRSHLGKKERNSKGALHRQSKLTEATKLKVITQTKCSTWSK